MCCVRAIYCSRFLSVSDKYVPPHFFVARHPPLWGWGNIRHVRRLRPDFRANADNTDGEISGMTGGFDVGRRKRTGESQAHETAAACSNTFRAGLNDRIKGKKLFRLSASRLSMQGFMIELRRCVKTPFSLNQLSFVKNNRYQRAKNSMIAIVLFD